MHALIVVSHPKSDSLTHSIAGQVAEGISAQGSGHTCEIADLAAEGFDPRYTETDVAVYRREAALPAEIAAEQARVDRADALVLVYPIYWWGMPGLLKGWIDRVFTNGWAYEEMADGKIGKKLGRLKVHLIAIGGAEMRTYARHGYFAAMRTQIDHGIFGYCGARVVTSELMLLTDPEFPQALMEKARAIGGGLFAV